MRQSHVREPSRRRGSTDPYGLALLSPFLAPFAALVGLVLVAVVTVGLINGELPRLPGGGPGGGPDGPGRTAAPSNVVVVDPRSDVPGSIVYVKAGNLWIQQGATARQITTGGGASMPAWAPDGSWIYYIESIDDFTVFPVSGRDRRYHIVYTVLMRVRPDGSGAEEIASGRYDRGRHGWFFWIREPAVSPDGSTIAVTSDGPNPLERNVVVQLFDVATGTFSVPSLPETAPLGHQAPAWHPDGGSLLYVRNDRDGARGVPAILRYDLATQRASSLTGPGYQAPSWSPDGRFVAATRTTGFGTDVVILDGTTGAEVMRVTTDNASWAPAWSPKGDAIAFLHMAAGIIDLRMVSLEGTGPAFTLGESLNLTEVSGLEGASAPRWFIPPEELPPPTAPPASPDPAGSLDPDGSPDAASPSP